MSSIEAVKAALFGDGSGPRVEVWQGNRVVGDVPSNFDPEYIDSQSYFYDVRKNDFTWAGDKWIACRTLCPGDFDAVPGFRRTKR